MDAVRSEVIKELREWAEKEVAYTKMKDFVRDGKVKRLIRLDDLLAKLDELE